MKKICLLAFTLIATGVSVLCKSAPRAVVIESEIANTGSIGSSSHLAKASQPKHLEYPAALPAQKLRREKLEILKQRWLSQPRTEGVVGDDRQLARESAHELLCSSELVELIEYLKENGVRTVDNAFNLVLSELFSSADGKAARQNLIALNLNSRYREEWSYFAGMGTPSELFEGFCSDLNQRLCSQNAVLGRARQLLSTDPNMAVSLAIREKENCIQSTHSDLILCELMEALPENTEFSTIAELLQFKHADVNEELKTARERLLRRWGRSDPIASADYVMSDPKSFDPQLMGQIAGSLAQRNPSAAVEWVQNLPQGLYQDSAVSCLTPQICQLYPKEAAELIEIVTDPKIKKQCFDKIKEGQARLAEIKSGGH